MSSITLRNTCNFAARHTATNRIGLKCLKAPAQKSSRKNHTLQLGRRRGFGSSIVRNYADKKYPSDNKHPSPLDEGTVPENPGQERSSIMETIKNTLAANLGGPAQNLGTHQFSLEDVPDLSGKVAVVTGGSEGIGYGCTHTLLAHNIAKLYVLSPDDAVVRDAQAALAKDLGQDKATRTKWIHCDLANWAQTRAVADDIIADQKKSSQGSDQGTGRLDMLLNNAGRGIVHFELTNYGVDANMAVNHIGHAVLTARLLPLLRATADRHDTTVRIVNQASNAHQSAPSDVRFESLDELAAEVGGPSQVYGRSKLAQILYTRWFDRRERARLERERDAGQQQHNDTQATTNMDMDKADAQNPVQHSHKEASAEHNPHGAVHPKVLMNATHPGFVSTKQTKQDIFDAYPLGGYAMAYGVEKFIKDQFQGAVSMMFAATYTDQGGQYIVPPCKPEEGTAQSQDPKLADNLMELTAKVVKEKTGEELDLDA